KAILAEAMGLRSGMPDAETVNRALADAEARVAAASSGAVNAENVRAAARRGGRPRGARAGCNAHRERAGGDRRGAGRARARGADARALCGTAGGAQS